MGVKSACKSHLSGQAYLFVALKARGKPLEGLGSSLAGTTRFFYNTKGYIVFHLIRWINI